MKHGMKETLCILILACMILGLMSGCAMTDSRECRQIVQDYEAACQNGDLDSILKCLDQDSARLIRGITGVAGNLFSVEDEVIMDRVSEILFGVDFVADFMKTIEFDIDEIDSDGEMCARGTMSYQNLLGSHVSREVKITFKQEDGAWHIYKIKFV